MILLHHLTATDFKQFERIELTFPDAGTVLIEGHNESGKSSLFDAVFFALFGTATGEMDGRGDAKELRRYHADAAEVTLGFSVNGKRFTVTRTQGERQTVRLHCPGTDGDAEVIRTLTAANGRIREELGMSGAALLNTCFVEQKRLEKLESLDPAKRRDTINELMNLKALSMLDDQFKVRRADGDAISAAKRRVEVAQQDASLPGLEQTRDRAQRYLALATLAAIAEDRLLLDDEEGRIAADLKEIREAAERLEVQTRLRNGYQSRRDAVDQRLLPLLTNWKNATEIHKAAREKAAESRSARDRLDRERGDREKARQWSHLLDRLEQIEEDDRRRTQTDQDRKELEAQLVAKEGEAEAARRAVAKAEIRQAAAERRAALLEWAAAARGAERARQPMADAGMPALRQRLGDAESGARAAQVRLASSGAAPGVPGFAAAGFGAVAAIGSLPGHMTVLLLVGVLLLAAGIVFGMWRIQRARQQAADEMEAAQQHMHTLAAEIRGREAMRTVIDVAAFEQAAQTRLDALKALPFYASGNCIAVRLPATPMEAEGEAGQIPEQPAVSDARTALQAANYALAPLEQEIERLRGAASTLARREESPWTRADRNACATVREDLAAAGLPTVSIALAARIGEITINFQRTESLAADLDAHTQEAQMALEGRTRCQKGFAEAFTSVSEGLGISVPTALDAAAESALGAVRKALDSWITSIDPATLKAEEEEIQSRKEQKTRRQGEIANRRRQLAADEAPPRDALVVAETLPLSQIFTAYGSELAAARDKTPDAWSAELGRLENAVRDNRSRRDALAKEAGLTDTVLVLADEQANFEAATLARDIKARAQLVVQLVRQRVLERVLPGTEAHVKRILPILTDNRYRDIRWIAEDNRIEVLDSRKGDFVAKKVFSGGARDQISLSLRLAFALATLPGEYSVRPGWLFLDEPLSSFDERRTRALVDLLTKGVIRRQFAQIFLVSHSKSFDPDLFDYRIEMEEGRVVRSALSSRSG